MGVLLELVSLVENHAEGHGSQHPGNDYEQTDPSCVLLAVL